MLFTQDLEQWYSLQFLPSDMKGCHGHIWMEERKKGEKMCLWDRQTRTELENRLAIRLSLLSLQNSPSPASKPCHPSPHCEGHPDRQPRKPGLQTVTTLILPDKSLVRLIRPSLLFFFFSLLNVKNAVELKDFPRGAAKKISRLWQTKINSYNLDHKSNFKVNANLVLQRKRLASSFKDGAPQTIQAWTQICFRPAEPGPRLDAELPHGEIWSHEA